MNIDHYDILSPEDGAANVASVTPSTITWRARDRELQTPVFIRHLRPECRDNADARELFMKQARTLALLRHAGVPAVYRLGEQDGNCFCTHEPLEGTNLQEVVAKGVLAPAEALDIAVQIARVFEAANEQGIVHAAWGPQDVVRVSRSTVKLASFDVVTAEEAASPRETDVVSLRASLEFSSPERLRGAPFDARSNFYTLGTILWFILTGKPPFRGTEAVVANGHLQTSPPLEEIAYLSPALVDLLVSLLQKDPDRRPGTPAALVHGIQSARAAALPQQPELTPLGVGALFASGPAVTLPTFTAAREPMQRNARRTAFVEFVIGTLVAVFLFFVLSRPATDVPSADAAGLNAMPTLATPALPPSP